LKAAAMTALGQKRPIGSGRVMSAFAPKAGIFAAKTAYIKAKCGRSEQCVIVEAHG
jgi:hypothetical protein